MSWAGLEAEAKGHDLTCRCFPRVKKRDSSESNRDGDNDDNKDKEVLAGGPRGLRSCSPSLPCSLCS